MEKLRKPGSGVWNIIRFNRHFYILAIVLLSVVFYFSTTINSPYDRYLLCFCGLGMFVLLISLTVSAYIYDLSDLYRLNWVKISKVGSAQEVVNIHAGFDETSILLRTSKHHTIPETKFHVFDFYDEKKHTEISVKRARKVCIPYPGTVSISSTQIPLANNTVDIVYCLLAAHEIREEQERIQFFTELRRILKKEGIVILTEHLRDLPNFIAYNIGAFHFHSKASWQKSFAGAGLLVSETFTITPFITTFVLTQHGDTF